MTLPPLTFNAWLRYDVVRRLMPADVRSVLEIGCGQGAVGARLAAAGYDYLGLEPDDVSYRRAAMRLAAVGRGEVRHEALAALDSGARFDLACAFEVLEHLEDDEQALGEWAARLRPGGWLMLSTPAFGARYAAADEMAGHFRRYDPDEMGRLLTAAGLTEAHVVVYGAPLGYALEAARNALGRRRSAATAAAPMSARTSASGRLFQPDNVAMGVVTQAATSPFRLLQRAFPGRGTGLVAMARKPAARGSDASRGGSAR